MSDMTDDRPRHEERAVYWRPKGIGGIELLEARFVRHAYARHTHDAYALGVVEEGVQTFRHRGSRHVTPTHGIVTVNPDEVHDGQSARPSGYRYRMFYVSPKLYAETLSGLLPRSQGLPLFPESVADDPWLAGRLLAAHRSLDEAHMAGRCPLEGESHLLDCLVALALRHARARPQCGPLVVGDWRVARARQYMAARFDRGMTLGSVAAEVGLSPYHFLRAFRRSTGLPPHAWLNQLRLDRSRELLRLGVAPAEAAVAVGFVDQSHLTRRFKGAYGITPGQFAAASHA